MDSKETKISLPEDDTSGRRLWSGKTRQTVDSLKGFDHSLNPNRDGLAGASAQWFTFMAMGVCCWIIVGLGVSLRTTSSETVWLWIVVGSVCGLQALARSIPFVMVNRLDSEKRKYFFLHVAAAGISLFAHLIGVSPWLIVGFLFFVSSNLAYRGSNSGNRESLSTAISIAVLMAGIGLAGLDVGATPVLAIGTMLIVAPLALMTQASVVEVSRAGMFSGTESTRQRRLFGM